MSGPAKPDGPANLDGPGAPPAADPSMDDILASIRRILNEDDASKPAGGDAPDDVLVLDSSMMVAPEQPPVPPAAPAPPAPIRMPAPDPPPPAPQAAAPQAPPPDAGLIAPAAAAAAASSVGELMRTLAAERNTAVHRGGPTLEDLVRDEMRPMLKSWLDSHLPPLVERLVRAEIERVVGRMAG